MTLNWKAKFSQEIAEISPSTGDDFAILHAAFSQKKIACAEFLSWAQKEIEIPILNAEFFENFQWNAEVYEKHAVLKTIWSPLCVPIAQWDGQTIVAGCDFPESVKNENFILVLTHYNHTEKIWNQIPKAVAKSENAEFNADDLALPNITTSSSDEALDFLKNVDDSTPAPIVMADIQMETSDPAKLEEVAAPVKPKAPPAVEKVESYNWKPVADKWEDLKNEMLTNFERVYLLICNHEEKIVFPELWSENVTPPESDSTVNLQSPSIFKIVYTSQKSYHGYVVNNEINDSFFNQWNDGSVPEHVTMSPILKNNTIQAMLMGIGSKNCGTPNTLKLAERLAHEIQELLVANKKAA